MSYLRYLYLFVYSAVFLFRVSLLSVTIDCLFMIAPSVFSNVYFRITLFEYNIQK